MRNLKIDFHWRILRKMKSISKLRDLLKGQTVFQVMYVLCRRWRRQERALCMGTV